MDPRAEACKHREDIGALHAPTHPDPYAIAKRELPAEASGRPRAKKKDDSLLGPPAPPHFKVERQRHRGPALLPEKL